MGNQKRKSKDSKQWSMKHYTENQNAEKYEAY
jgi:hypothetical protein